MMQWWSDYLDAQAQIALSRIAKEADLADLIG
jgi:hypothetical protein